MNTPYGLEIVDNCISCKLKREDCFCNLSDPVLKAPSVNGKEVRVSSGLTHEEMAQMIGASRETVTRLLSDLRKKQLIRLEGSTLVIRNRIALEAMVS